MSRGRFTWPPMTPAPAAHPKPRDTAAPPSHESASAVPGAASPAAPAGFGAVRRATERIWLGLSTPPLEERIADAGWAPDEPWVYCSRCGQEVGPHEADDTGCSRCRARRVPWDRLIRLGGYTGLLREAVQEVKYSRWRRLGHDLGILLGRSLGVALDNTGISRRRAVLVPVPCSFRRRLVRGIDHTLVLTRGLAAATGIPMVRALSRSHRPSQITVPPSQRAANVSGSISPRRGIDLSGAVVVVVDDVTTTGATLAASCRAVRQCRKARPDNELRQVGGVWAAVVAATPSVGPANGSRVSG